MINIELSHDQIHHIIFALEKVEEMTVERLKSEGKWDSPCDACPHIINILKKAVGDGEYAGWFVRNN
jgi:hypothetical protein